MVAITTAVQDERDNEGRLARLRGELARRDEIIVGLQHVIRDLRHEIENLRAEHVYAAFTRGMPPSAEDAERPFIDR